MLILTDTSVGAEQNPIWRMPAVSDWLDDNADQYRVWDDSHTDFEYVDAAWQDGYQRAIAESDGVRPWVLVSGTKQAAQQLPPTGGQLLKLLEACL